MPFGWLLKERAWAKDWDKGRSMHDRALIDGASLYAAAAAFPIADVTTIDLPARAHQPARQAKLSLRFGRVTIKRPQGASPSLANSVDLTLIEVVEVSPPAGAEPLHWRLLTTHEVADADPCDRESLTPLTNGRGEGRANVARGYPAHVTRWSIARSGPARAQAAKALSGRN